MLVRISRSISDRIFAFVLPRKKEPFRDGPSSGQPRVPQREQWPHPRRSAR